MWNEQSYEDLIAELSIIRPPSHTDDFDHLIFEYDTNEEDVQQPKTRVYYVRGDGLYGMNWMIIFIGINNVRSNTLEWAHALLAANTEIAPRDKIPRWIALGDSSEPVLVLQVDWSYLSATVLDTLVEHTVKEMTNMMKVTVETAMKEREEDTNAGTAVTVPRLQEPLYRTFDELITAMQPFRATSERSNGYVLDYDGAPVRLIPGNKGDSKWFDIQITLTGIEISTRLDWAHTVLLSNRDMCQATPIPTWFAIDEDKRILLVNRLYWQTLEAKALDSHIVRSITDMKQALIEIGVGRILAQHHHATHDLHVV